MLKLVVLVSGGGTNLQAIIDAIQSGKLNAQIEFVIADRDCYGLKRAQLASIPTIVVDRKVHKDNLSVELLKHIPESCDLVVMAGFLSILNSQFIKSFTGKVINIHPSLLPKFGGAGMWGMHVHKAVIDAGEKYSGCTVHYVTEEVDGGEIIKQSVVEVLPSDSCETLQKRILAVEHSTLVAAIEIFDKKGK